MKTNNSSEMSRFKAVDILYLVLAALPLLGGMVLRVLTRGASEGIEVTGAQIYFSIPMPIQDLVITESQINSWLVILSIFWLIRYLTHGLTVNCATKRQMLAEWAVEKCEGLVKDNMGDYFLKTAGGSFVPFIMAIMVLSAFSSLVTLVGLFPPTSDINVVAGWAILVFIIITYYKNKCGPIHYLKSFADPALMTPLNVISEVATPVSMAFRHYGNVLSGAVISTLVGTALAGLSKMLFGWLPGVLGEIPFLQIGIPAILSVYFDLFSGLLQAFIFAMLTMLYVSGGFALDDWQVLKAKREAKKAERQKNQSVA